MRPWTYIATDKQTGVRESNYFQAGFDSKQATEEFREKYPNKHLEALMPGTHVCVTFKTSSSKMIYNLGDIDGED